MAATSSTYRSFFCFVSDRKKVLLSGGAVGKFKTGAEEEEESNNDDE